MSSPSKITAAHLDRLALVYVRQSTLAQVRHNTESTARQYGLVDEAARMGWDASRIVVIDDDLGLSGRSASIRKGFNQVISRVCLGEVGAIFGLEVSRLARSSADLQRLLEFCSVTDTLVVDADGVYDLRSFNDRLLLGLKGTMSEAELHILAGRLQESRRAAARRGELRFPLPVGYARDEDGRTVMDPDEEIRATVADVFAAFQAAGSAYGVVRLFADRRFPHRAYGGVWAGEVRWGHITHQRVLGMLSNPAYAGAYVFGRYRVRRTVEPDGTIRSGTVELPREQWSIVIHDHHPAYISWDTFLANREKLAANTTSAGARPPREGSALLQGIVLCGGCGRSMNTTYRTWGPWYSCTYARADHMQTARCRSIKADGIDAAVAERVLARVTPQELELALAAADEVRDRRGRSHRALELAVERARYEAARAERAFHLCEPENRLVARSLEQRWEARLVSLAEAEAAVARAEAETVPLPPRTELEALARDLPRLWSAATTSPRDRKRLLRTLVSDVTLSFEPDNQTVRVGLRWHTGFAEEITVSRPEAHGRTSAEAIALVRRCASLPDKAVVAELSAAGVVTGVGRPFDTTAVRWLRKTYGIQGRGRATMAGPNERSVRDAAHDFGVKDKTVYEWIRQGRLPAHCDAAGRLCVPAGAPRPAGSTTYAAARRRTPGSLIHAGGAV
jgi:DNA invertase Pin-like site-specific DNA recombinase